jgi:hypothetical protein
VDGNIFNSNGVHVCPVIGREIFDLKEKNLHDLIGRTTSPPQHPLQMLFIFLSTLESWASSARMASSPCIAGPEVTVPSIRPPVAPPAGLPAVPTVVEPIGAPPPDVDPAEFAVPAELVPGVLDALAALPAPLGSLPELLGPPTLAGPVTPLTAAVPAPAEPALGELVAPADPPAEAPPDPDPPPADPPPLPPPPPLCARIGMGESSNATTSNLHDNEWGIENSFSDQRAAKRRVPEQERIFCDQLLWQSTSVSERSKAHRAVFVFSKQGRGRTKHLAAGR